MIMVKGSDSVICYVTHAQMLPGNDVDILSDFHPTPRKNTKHF